MPGDNSSWLADDQDVAPRGLEAAEQNPKYSILDSQARTRMLSLEYAQLLKQGKDLDAQVVVGTEKGAEAGEEANQ
jgi:hypothetical protein